MQKGKCEMMGIMGKCDRETRLIHENVYLCSNCFNHMITTQARREEQQAETHRITMELFDWLNNLNPGHNNAAGPNNDFIVCVNCNKLKPIEVMSEINPLKCRICANEEIRLFGKVLLDL